MVNVASDMPNIMMSVLSPSRKQALEKQHA